MADVSRWLFIAAVAITVIVALLFYPGPTGDPRSHAGRLLVDRRPPDRQDRHPLPRHDLPPAGHHAGIGVRHGVATHSPSFAGRCGRRADCSTCWPCWPLVFLGWMCWNTYLATPGGCRSVPVPRWALPHEHRHAGRHRRDHASRFVGQSAARRHSCSSGSGCARTGCTSITGRSIR